MTRRDDPPRAGHVRRWLARAAAAMALAALLAGLPAALVVVVGWPLPTTVPTVDTLRGWLGSPITDQTVIDVLAVLAWYLWIQFAAAVTVEIRAQRHGANPPRLRLSGGAQQLAAALVTTLTMSVAVTTIATLAGAHTPPPVFRSAPAAALVVANHVAPVAGPTPGLPEHSRPATIAPTPLGHITVVVGDTHHSYEVEHGDNLSKIAHDWLGEADRWPEIYALNRGRHWTNVSGDTRLANPNLIFPGWVLDLPTDARPPAHAHPAHPAHQPAPTPAQPGAQANPPPAVPTTPAPTPPPTSTSPSAGQPSPSAAAGNVDDGVAANPPVPIPPAATGPAATTTPTPTASGAPARPSVSARRQPAGITLPGGIWLDTGLGLALLAAAALVWAHRRRRYTPRPPSTTLRLDEPEFAPMPAVIGQIRRGLTTAGPDDTEDGDIDLDPETIVDSDVPDVSPAGDGASRPVVPALTNPVAALWPPAGLGLIGPGAEAAARGFLTAALAAGGVEDPDERGRVVIPAATLATLLGVAAVNVADTPRLTVTGALTEALELLEEQTLHRTRAVYDHEVDNIAALRRADPREEPPPPLILIADAATAHERARVTALLAQGQRLDIHGVLLGDWPDGDTVIVAIDGTTSRAEADRSRHGTHPADLGRLAVLNPAETADILAVLAESHTGQAPAHPHPTRPAGQPGLVAAGGTANDDKTRPTVDADGVAGTPPGREPGVADDGKRAHASLNGHVPAVPVTSAVTAGGEPISDESNVASTVEERVEVEDARGSTTPADAADDDGDETGPDPVDDDTTSVAPARRARLSVLGQPRLDDTGAPPGDPLRAKAMELLVYLAVNERGATQEAILDDLLGSAPASKAPHRLDTYVYNLRKTLRRCAGPGNHLIRTGHRYTLNPDLFDIDLWHMRQAIAEAERDVDPVARVAALHRAVDAYTGELAQDRPYDWIEPVREGIRTQALDATLALADAVADDDPRRALTILDTARAHSPTAEPLYTAAMRVHAHAGNPDGIRATMRALERALVAIDTEPSDDVTALFQQLTAVTGTDRNRGRQL